MIITFNNSKGGVAKTTSCAIIAQILCAAGYRTLVLDLDPQGNLSVLLGAEIEKTTGISISGSTSEISINITSDTILTNDVPAEDLKKMIKSSNFKDLEVLPATSNLSDIIYEMHDLCDTDDSVLLNLRKNLGKLGEYDYILIDTSPFKSYLTYAAICASDIVYTPIEADNFSYEGLRDILNTIEEINTQYSLEVKFGGTFITKADTRTTRFRQISEGYEETLGDKFIPTPIRRYEAIGQSSTAFVPLLEWDKKCLAVMDYIALLNRQELIDMKHYRKLNNFLKGGK